MFIESCPRMLMRGKVSSAVAGMNSMKEAIHTVKDLDDALVELKKSSEK